MHICSLIAYLRDRYRELDGLRSQTQTAQSESAAAASQASQMISLNLKLQSTVSKNQARSIELEVKRIEARESRELLGIVQPYLPQIYVETDNDATQCYLFFRRLAAKADLINMVTAQIHGLPDALNGAVPDVLVGVTEVRNKHTIRKRLFSDTDNVLDARITCNAVDFLPPFRGYFAQM
jgi:dynactin 1